MSIFYQKTPKNANFTKESAIIVEEVKYLTGKITKTGAYNGFVRRCKTRYA